MVMRYRGGGVGHKSTRDATSFFLKDRHKTDIKARQAASGPSTEKIDDNGGDDGDREWEDVEVDGSKYLVADNEVSDEEERYSGEESDEDDEERIDYADDALGPEEGMVADELDDLGLAEL
ncbi:hypothetical protein CPC08DRAFT_413191 [Agrocybe pediades]|nr:hypothetical protein CPC08DRAFT_413191 [Agrocybe pediades]